MDISDIQPLTGFESLNNLRKEDHLCDITIICENSRFNAHKVVLAARCPYFKALFTSGMRESQMTEVKLTSTPADMWSKILDYMYTEEIEITPENVKDIIWVANRFQIDSLCKKCIQFLRSRLAPENVVNIRKFADWLGYIELKTVATTMLSDHFETVINQDEFLSISCPELIEILQIDFLRVRSEYVILYAALRWIQSDLKNRSEEAFHVLQHIHLESFSDQAYVQRLVNKLPVEIISPECCEKFINEICERRSKRRMAQRLNSDDTLFPRFFPPKSVYVAGGRNSRSCLTSLESYDPVAGRWKNLEPMTSQRTAVSMSSLNNHVYCIGGERENPQRPSETLYLNEVERYSPQFNCWSAVCSLLSKRSFGASSVCQGKMYAIGGENDWRCHNSVEEYDEERNVWAETGKMKQLRSGVTATCVAKRIYAIGGHDNYSNIMHHKTVESFDPREGKWSYAMGLNIGRSGATACPIDDKIYLAGGRNRRLGHFFDLCECYEPRMDRWYPVASMRTARAWPGSATFDNKFLVMGGYDCNERLKTVEMYDPIRDKWDQLENMLMCRAGAAASMI